MRRPVGVILCTVAAIALGGCKMLPLAHLTPLPTAHQVPVQQLVFHTDFELDRNGSTARVDRRA